MKVMINTKIATILRQNKHASDDENTCYEHTLYEPTPMQKKNKNVKNKKSNDRISGIACFYTLDVPFNGMFKTYSD